MSIKNSVNIVVLTQPGSFTSLGNQLVKLLPYETRAVDWQKARGEVADVVIALWWHPIARGLLDGMIVRKAVVGCVFDLFSWAASLRGREALRRSLGCFDVLVVGSEAILRALRSTYGSLPPTFICETGADVHGFKHMPLPQTFKAMWCGNSAASTAERDLKGLKLIKRACERMAVELQLADSAEIEGPSVKRCDMPIWYANGSVYVCASESEGTPRPLLEALATGRPVVTTRVGCASRLIHHGINGCIVERSEEGLLGGIRYVRQLLTGFPDQTMDACRQAALAWSEDQMKPKWVEVIAAVKNGPWWRSIASPQAPQVIRKPSVGLPNRRDLEAKELATWQAPEALLQSFVQQLEDHVGVNPGRPTVAIPTPYRFLSRTMYLLDHLVRDYAFIVGEHSADLVWNLYPFSEWATKTGHTYVQTMRGQFWHMPDRTTRQAVEVYSRAEYIATLTKSLHRDLVHRWPHLGKISHSVIRNGHFDRQIQAMSKEALSYQRPILLCVTNFHFEGKRQAVEELGRELDRRNFRGTFLVVAQPPPRGIPVPTTGTRGHYLGFHSNCLALYRSADLFLYHSYIDGQPTSLIEAMSAGLPVVVGTAPHSGASEFVIPGKTGLTFTNPRDGVSQALEMLIQPVQARAMAMAAKEWLKSHCSWMGAAAQYDEVFQKVLGISKKPTSLEKTVAIGQ